MKALTLCLSIVLAASAATAVSQQETFRATTDAVTVDVSVRDGRHPVPNLSVGDFVLLDDGVPQQVDSVDVAPTGIDLTAIMDISGSASPFATWMLAGIRDVRDLLRPDDRAELLAVGRHVWASTAPMDEVLRMTPPVIGDGGSHVFDAITAAAMKAVEPGRRHLVIVFTDGFDTRSVVPAEARQQVLRRSSAVVELFAVSIAGRTNNSGMSWVGGPNAGQTEIAGDYNYVLQTVADAAGGGFYDMKPGERAAGRLKNIIDAFRQHYLLRYRPAGVSASGWHTLKVSVRSRRYDVVARRGYERSR